MKTDIDSIIEQYSSRGVVLITRSWGSDYKCEIRWDSGNGLSQTSWGGPMPLDFVVATGKTLMESVENAIHKLHIAKQSHVPSNCTT